MKRLIYQLNHSPQHPGTLFLQLGFLTAFILLSTGCEPKSETADDSIPAATLPATNAVGAYALVSVDGKPVPCSVTHDGHRMVIKSGRFLINPDGTCQSQMFLEGRDAGIEVRAAYTQMGSKLTMKWQGAGITIGDLEEDTFTMNNEGMLLAYHRQAGNGSEPLLDPAGN